MHNVIHVHLVPFSLSYQVLGTGQLLPGVLRLVQASGTMSVTMNQVQLISNQIKNHIKSL